MDISNIQTQTKTMIDDLKSVCANYGLGNASSEYKIITEVFLYKFLNDKFIAEVRKATTSFADFTPAQIEEKLSKMNIDDYEDLLLDINADTAKLSQKHFISYLFNNQNQEDFHKLFDATLEEISNNNIDVFAVKTGGDTKIKLFDPISQHVTESSSKDDFCKALIGKIVGYSFDKVFEQKYDFFATVFEYLIKDYNKDFGKYAEYYTPHSIARIIAKIMVPNGDKNVTVYDPAAGSGTLVLSLAHEIGEQNCTIYTQDISQKSNEFLRLNLILNNLVHSLNNVVREDTLIKPVHKENDDVMHFNYIVSNPPFKVDFSDNRDTLAGEKFQKRFFAGVPNIPNKDKSKMSIYLMFLQHIIHSLADNGKAAVVVPTGFLTAGSGIEMKIRQHLIDNEMLRGVISMPSNIFATTGTNVSVLVIDKSNKGKKVLLMDASNLGTSVKDDSKNQKTVLSADEITKIIDNFNNQNQEDDFSVLLDYSDIKAKKYSFSAGQYFEVKIEYSELTKEEFSEKMTQHTQNLQNFFNEGEKLQKEIMEHFKKVKYE